MKKVNIMDKLKTHHLIVLCALFLSLVGTLLLLGKINEDATPLTGATAVPPFVQEDNEEETTIVRIIDKGNQTEEEDS